MVYLSNIQLLALSDKTEDESGRNITMAHAVRNNVTKRYLNMNIMNHLLYTARRISFVSIFFHSFLVLVP